MRGSRDDPLPPSTASFPRPDPDLAFETRSPRTGDEAAQIDGPRAIPADLDVRSANIEAVRDAANRSVDLDARAVPGPRDRAAPHLGVPRKERDVPVDAQMGIVPVDRDLLQAQRPPGEAKTPLQGGRPSPGPGGIPKRDILQIGLPLQRGARDPGQGEVEESMERQRERGPLGEKRGGDGPVVPPRHLPAPPTARSATRARSQVTLLSQVRVKGQVDGSDRAEAAPVEDEGSGGGIPLPLAPHDEGPSCVVRRPCPPVQMRELHGRGVEGDRIDPESNPLRARIRSDGRPRGLQAPDDEIAPRRDRPLSGDVEVIDLHLAQIEATPEQIEGGDDDLEPLAGETERAPFPPADVGPPDVRWPAHVGDRPDPPRGCAGEPHAVPVVEDASCGVEDDEPGGDQEREDENQRAEKTRCGFLPAHRFNRSDRTVYRASPLPLPARGAARR